MDFKRNDKILVANDMADPTSIREYTVTLVGKDTLQCNNTPEMTFYKAFCWPSSVRAKLTEILEQRAALKKAYDDSMKLVYQLRNSIERGEIK